MHSFSPLRFDLKNSGVEYVTVTRAVSIGPLEKNLRPDSKFALLRCGAFRDTTAHRIYVAFWDMSNARTGEAPYIQSIAQFRRRNFSVKSGVSFSKSARLSKLTIVGVTQVRFSVRPG
jgi:hypothetical protein